MDLAITRFRCCRGDLNGDDTIDGDDFAVFLAAFGHSDGDPEFDLTSDLDCDGMITIVDYQEWLQFYRDFIGDPLAPPPSPGGLGDMNGDQSINGADIQGFTEVLMDPTSCGFRGYIVADVNGDGVPDTGDIGPFVELLLGELD